MHTPRSSRDVVATLTLLPRPRHQSADRSTPFRALAVRHPLALFLALAFGLAYPLAALVVLVQRGILPGAAFAVAHDVDLERVAALAILLGGLGPATLIVTALEGGRPALRSLARRVFRWQVAPGWWLFVAAALPALTFALAALMGDTPRLPSAGDLARQALSITIALGLVNLWEEMAWAGFLQTRLERRSGFFAAAALTALPFAAIHLPLQIIGGATVPLDLAVAFVILALVGIVLRALLGAALRGTGDSLLATGLLHTAFNEANGSDGIVALFLDGSNRQGAALLATLLLAVILGVTLCRRLGRAERLRLDTINGEGAQTD